jgi:hypothetical protein
MLKGHKLNIEDAGPGFDSTSPDKESTSKERGYIQKSGDRVSVRVGVRRRVYSE